jgi:hypothetical protein
MTEFSGLQIDPVLERAKVLKVWWITASRSAIKSINCDAGSAKDRQDQIRLISEMNDVFQDP